MKALEKRLRAALGRIDAAAARLVGERDAAHDACDAAARQREAMRAEVAAAVAAIDAVLAD